MSFSLVFKAKDFFFFFFFKENSNKMMLMDHPSHKQTKQAVSNTAYKLMDYKQEFPVE
jgi:hypothetical protein